MDIEEIVISDLMGKELSSYSNISHTNTFSIDASDLASGLYIITILDKVGIRTVHEIIKIE